MSSPEKVWICEECNKLFTEEEKNKGCEKEWGHICKMKKYKIPTRCESYLTPYQKTED